MRIEAGRTIRRIALPLGLLAAWQLSGSPAGVRDALPTPSSVISSGVGLVASGELPNVLAMSLGRAVAGFAIAMALALGLGVTMALVGPAQRWLEPIVETLRPISPIALAPLAILWFGAGPFAPLAIVVYAALFPALVNTLAVVREVDPTLIAAARTLGVGPSGVIAHVLLPGALPGVLVGARLALGNAWRSLILAELLVGARSSQGFSGGIGALMFSLYSFQVDIRGIIVCMLVAGAVGLLFDRALRGFAPIMAPWSAADR
jgi:ABC-type nitrate/sulfonate/bicarbonate transport system permease component